MLPDDANFAGNVHGGTILMLIEEAGGIVASRYCNAPRQVSITHSELQPSALTESRTAGRLYLM